MRALRITLRTAHIGSASVALGAALFGGQGGPATAVLVVTGMIIVGTDVAKHGLSWFRYLQGVAGVTKISLLIVGLFKPEWLVGCMGLALIVGSLISHAPGSVRHWAWVGEPGPCAG